MDYKVISLKYRPQTFDDVIGQDHITKTIRNAIEKDKIGHAYIFSGPRGTGKTTTARILAKRVNCENPQDGNPCNECSSCKEISEDRSLDIVEIDGASNRGIDDIRSLREQVKYPPTKGKYKVFIIDEFHQITKDAFNALLKTLEEPPSYVLFIFATTELQKVIPTILSRCQRFEFKRIAINELIDRLKYICKEEKIDIDDDSLLLIAKKGDGSMRDAQSILEQAAAFSKEKIDYEMIIDILGIIKEEVYFDLIQSIIMKDINKLLSLINEMIMNGYDIIEFVSGFSNFLRDLYIVKSTNSTELLEATGNVKDNFKEISKNIEERRIIQMLSIVTDQMNKIKYSSNPRIIIESMFIKLSQLDDIFSISEILDGVENEIIPIKRKTKNISQRNTVNEPPKGYHTETETKIEVSGSKNYRSRILGGKNNKQDDLNLKVGKDDKNDVPRSEVNLSKIKDIWDEIIKSFVKTQPSLSDILGKMDLVKFANNILVLGTDNTFYLKKVEKNIVPIKKVIDKILNSNISIRVEKVELSDKKKKQIKSKEIPKSVKNVIEAFDGELV
ncbi:MAG: DNA polymerase III subunit gamma/tau, partial [Candidatus Marinimicrobia bacterium]|nr:DNA polymerase III subunit gamma/tau [Candidatus Neomarinimicrobiota bacterium]